MKRTLLLAALVVALVPGCGKKEQTNTPTPSPEPKAETPVNDPSATTSAEPVPGAPVAVPVTTSDPSAQAKDANATAPTADLNQLSIKLAGWMIANGGGPKNFDDWIARSHIQVPPPPAGKKYAINRKGDVVLLNK
jgi:hypothetical protein